MFFIIPGLIVGTWSVKKGILTGVYGESAASVNKKLFVVLGLFMRNGLWDA